MYKRQRRTPGTALPVRKAARVQAVTCLAQLALPHELGRTQGEAATALNLHSPAATGHPSIRLPSTLEREMIFDFILEKPATRPRDRCGKEQLVYPFVTGFPGSSRVSALAPYSAGDRVGSTLSTPHAGGDVGLFVGECSSPQTDAPTDDERVRLMSLTPPP